MRKNLSHSKFMEEWHKIHPHPKGMLNKKHTEKTKEQMRESRKRFLESHPHNRLGTKHTLETIHKLQEMHQKPENIQSAIRNLPKDCKGKANGHYGKPAGNSKRVQYKGIVFKSSWEAEFAKLLDYSNISWQYEPDRFYFSDCSYCPDFKLDENLYVEVKGFMSYESKKRIDNFREKYSEKTLVVVGKEFFEAVGYKVRKGQLI